MYRVHPACHSGGNGEACRVSSSDRGPIAMRRPREQDCNEPAVQLRSPRSRSAGSLRVLLSLRFWRSPRVAFGGVQHGKFAHRACEVDRRGCLRAPNPRHEPSASPPPRVSGRQTPSVMDDFDVYSGAEPPAETVRNRGTTKVCPPCRVECDVSVRAVCALGGNVPSAFGARRAKPFQLCVTSRRR
jgi:hypothetical protein